MADSVSRKRARRARPPTVRRQTRVADMTKKELEETVASTIEHKLSEWFGSPADVRDEQEWDRQFARSAGALTKLAEEARSELAEGKTEPLDPEQL